MALTTSLDSLAQALTRAVHNFAEAEGWSQSDYAMMAAFNRETEYLYLRVGSIQPLERHRWFRGIMDQLAIEFGSWARAAEAVNLTIRQLERLDQIADSFPLNDDEIDLTDMFS